MKLKGEVCKKYELFSQGIILNFKKNISYICDQYEINMLFRTYYFIALTDIVDEEKIRYPFYIFHQFPYSILLSKWATLYLIC